MQSCLLRKLFKSVGVLTALFAVSHSAIAQSLTFTSSPVTTGEYGVDYNYNIQVEDNTGNGYDIRISSGTPPAGISLVEISLGNYLLRGTPEEIGNFPLELEVEEDNFAPARDYQSFTLSISKTTITITADDKSSVYEQALEPLTYSYSSFANGDTESDLDTPPTINTTATTSSDAGTYPITVSGAADTNYDFTYVNADYTITKADQTITFNTLADKTYGAGDISLSATSDSGLPVSFSVTSGPATLLGNQLTITGAGEITIEATQAGNDNYNPAIPVSQSFTVAKKTLTATAENNSVVFNSPIPPYSITYNGFVNGDTETDLDTKPEANSAAIQGSDAGDYPITVSGGADDNYTFTYVGGTLTISKANQTIDFPGISDKVYGNSAFSLTATSSSGLPVSYSVISGNVSLSANNLSITGIGIVTIEAQQNGGTNYQAATPVQRSFSIAKAPLTISADDKTSVYNTALPTLTYEYSGFVYGETENDLDTAPTISTIATNSSPVGDYPISIADATSANYTITHENGTLSITKADQTISFGPISDKSYGEAPFTISASSSSGLPVSFAVLSGPATLNADKITINGTGTIVIEATQSGSSNYNAATAEQQSFAVEKAALLVEAEDQTITFGTAIPTLSLNYSGFVNGDDEEDLDTQPTANTTATSGSDVGTYPITVGGGVSENYEFSYSSGELTINKADQTITIDPIADKVFGDSPFEVNSSSTSGLPVALSLVSGPATLNDNEITITGAGTVIVEANQEGTKNYNEATSVQESFLVEKATASIEISNLAQNFDGTPKTVTVATTPSALNTVITYDGSSTAPSAKGTYLVEVEIDEVNYKGSKSATLVINGAPVSSGLPTSTYAEDSPQQSITLTDYFSDDEDPLADLVFSISNNSNPSLIESIEIVGDELRYTFVENANGTAEITITCEDTDGLTSSDVHTIQVTPVADEPFFSSSPITTVEEDELYTYEIVITDYDKNDDITITSALALPPWLSLNDHGDRTATLTGTPDNSNVGTVGVLLSAEDQTGRSATQLFNIEVENVNDAPTFTSSPPTTGANNVPYTYNITTDDVDANDEVSITFTNKPVWLSLTDNENGTGVLEGTPGNIHRNQSNFVRLKITDLAGAQTFQEFTINVDYPNSAPTFTSTAVTEAQEDENYSYLAKVSDTDGDQVIISALSLPNWLSFDSINAVTAEISGTPTNDHVGNHQVILEVEDFFGSLVTQKFTITVTNVNDAPVITSSPIESARQNILYNYAIQTEDIDAGDEVTITVPQKPDWLNFSNNTLSGTPSLEDVDNSPFSVEVIATDNSGATDTQLFDIAVYNENSPPTIDPITDPEALNEDNLEEQIIEFTGISAGVENDQTITINIENDKPGLFNNIRLDYTNPNSSATLRYTLAADSFGVAAITVIVKDDGAEDINTTTRSFQISVLPINDEPVFTSTPLTKGQPGTTYTYDIVCKDADPDDQLTIEATEIPTWLTLEDNGNGTATLTGTIPTSVDSENVELTVSDNANTSDTQSFSIRVNTAPSVAAISFEMEEDTPFTIPLEALQQGFADPDGDELLAVKFYSLPAGTFTHNGTNIEEDEEILLEENTTIEFTPEANFFGNVSVDWTGRDSFIYAESATIQFQVDSINDAPVISNIEPNTLDFEQGGEPSAITEIITISDVDDQLIDSAIVMISNNFNQDEDLLIYEPENDNELIEASYEASSGTLKLAGEESKSAYETAIRAIKYQNTNSLSTDTRVKGISIIVSDGRLNSQPAVRNVQLANLLPELDIVNAFTPDGSGVNDTWDFGNLNSFENVLIRVYATGGTLVFECNANDCEWDGTYNGDPMPAGTYYYIIQLNNGRRKYEGTVTILK